MRELRHCQEIVNYLQQNNIQIYGAESSSGIGVFMSYTSRIPDVEEMAFLFYGFRNSCLSSAHPMTIIMKCPECWTMYASGTYSTVNKVSDLFKNMDEHIEENFYGIIEHQGKDSIEENCKSYLEKESYGYDANVHARLYLQNSDVKRETYPLESSVNHLGNSIIDLTDQLKKQLDVTMKLNLNVEKSVITDVEEGDVAEDQMSILASEVSRKNAILRKSITDNIEVATNALVLLNEKTEHPEKVLRDSMRKIIEINSDVLKYVGKLEE